ncbi:hypothetical protein [Metabacillus fastidiosus]|uniref:hypothetical protein n=1 Tax=Metabacillus fastidiosus TaxID=1458 RepID=UPI003D2A99CB
MENKTRETKRINIVLSNENHSWFKQRAAEMGVSMSGLMAMALDSYKTQQIMANQIPDMLEAMEKFQLLQQLNFQETED